MSNNVIQTSFAGGELSPTLYARVDLAKYHIGAALLQNFFVDYRGGASNRPGTELVCRALSSDKPIRLIPFQFSTIQTYVLEFGDRYMRVIKNGAQVLEAAQSITSITNANPGVVTKAAHGYVDGNQVLFFVNGMAQVNNVEYFIFNATANTFQLKDWDGNIINTAGYGVFTSGTMARVYTVVSPYAAADLAMLKYTQSADVMTICHPSYPSYDLSRLSETNWQFALIVIGSTIVAPTGVALVASGVGTASYAYQVTAVNASGEESVASATASINNVVNIQAAAGSLNLTWGPITGAVSYNVYKAVPTSAGSLAGSPLFGYMATSYNAVSTDANIVPDFTYTPPIHTDPFTGSNYPGTVAYYQQRKVFAGSMAGPETFWMSQPGKFKNFDVSNPVIASDAITGTLVSRQVNNIKYMIAMPGGLIMLTGGGAWQVSGGGADAPVTPTSIVATPQAYNGCADIEPIQINYDILYVQQKGTVVRDLSYSFYTNIYTGADLSVLSNHLFTGYTITGWTYAEEPFKIVWATRSDGKLLSLTYLKEQEVFGWAQHQTQGRFNAIASIQEGQENAVYVGVQRRLQGKNIVLIERMHSRFMPYGAEDAWFVDSGLRTVPVANSSSVAAVFSVGGIDGVQSLVSSVSIFNVGFVGRVLRMAGGIATITAVTDGFNATVNVTQAFTDTDVKVGSVYVWPQTTWSIWNKVMTVAGLDHLEGETVSILADGNVVLPQVVINGTITLSQPCSKITAGLGYVGRLQTLYLDTGEPSIQGKRKFIPAMTVRVDQTRGLKMGPTFDAMTEFKDRDMSTLGQPIGLFTGDQRMQIDQLWATEGQMCLEQTDPLPASILGVIPEIQLGDSGK